MAPTVILIIGVLLMVAALAVIAWMITISFRDPPERQPEKLSFHQQKELANLRAQELSDKTTTRERLLASASDLVETRSSGRRLSEMLERSGSQLRVGEWLIMVGVITVILAGVSTMLRGAIAGVLTAIIVPIAARALVIRKIAKRQSAFAEQLPDLLQVLGASLRSGQSLQQAIAGMAPDMEDPAGEELRRIVIENRIGLDLVDSFRDLSARMDNQDFEWVVRAIDITYSTGGSLATILRRLDSTIRARNKVAGTVRALSAESKITGVVLGGLPLVVMLAIQFMNPGYLEPLFSTTLGRIMLGVAGLQLIIGSIWLNRMAAFKF